MFDENTVVEKIQVAELDKDKKYIIFMKYGGRRCPSKDILVSSAKHLQNLLKHLDINNVIVAPEVKDEIEYSIVESE